MAILQLFTEEGRFLATGLCSTCGRFRSNSPCPEYDTRTTAVNSSHGQIVNRDELTDDKLTKEMHGDVPTVQNE